MENRPFYAALRQGSQLGRSEPTIAFKSSQGADFGLVFRHREPEVYERSILNAFGPNRISAYRVIDAVAKEYGFTRDDLIDYGRTKNIVRCRQMAMYAARKLTNMTLPQIGRLLNRDHTTIIHGIEKIEATLTVAEIDMIRRLSWRVGGE